MSVNLQLDHRAALLAGLLAKFLDLPNSSRTGDVTAAFKDYRDEWQRVHHNRRKPDTIIDDDEVERVVQEDLDTPLDRTDSIIEQLEELAADTLNPGDDDD